MTQKEKTKEDLAKEIRLLQGRIAELEGPDGGRRQAEEALRREHEQFRELFDNMSNGVAVYKARDDGEDFIFTDMNRAGERASKVSREEIVGKSVLRVFPSIKKVGLLE
ncbi:MAG: PAS domain-containing protein, partial [Candidatus Omnitrophica bacterium]|nr:PAS domain-containing protein [Candidatus Omnitrophota bacterium]